MKNRADVVELLSRTTTTQQPQTAHARYPITVTMPITTNKPYNYAAIEPDNPGYSSNEWASHHTGNFSLGRHWW